MSETECSLARDGVADKTFAPRKTLLRRLPKRAALAIFARVPQLGKVKTRLARSVGNEAALRLYVAMLRDTLALAQRAMRSVRGETIVFFTPRNAPFSPGEYSREARAAFHARRALGENALSQKNTTARAREYSQKPNALSHDALSALWAGAAFPQCEGDLGKKMRVCCDELRARGAHRVVILGADAPDLPPEIIVASFAALQDCDFVFGPAHDGGFYLIGASRKIPRALFSGVRWSRSDVLSRVLANARRENLRVLLLPIWRDVDDLDDLRALKKRLKARC